MTNQTLYQKAVDSRIWVVKIGSAMLTDHGRTIDRVLINQLANQIAVLRKAGKQVILVSSGAIAVGLQKLGWEKKPGELAKQQAAAAVGQMTLARVYEEIFVNYNIQTAQVLLTHDDASDRKRYLNIKSTVGALLEHHILPIVNENDTTSFDEIKFGDNDNLGALVANLVHAGLYVILTDQAGLYTADPRSYPDAELVRFDFANNPNLDDYVGSSKSTLGSGGMLTKIQAARKAMNSGTTTVIMHGQRENGITGLLSGEFVGTMLFAGQQVRAKKQWLAGQLQTRGVIVIDKGAEKALLKQGKSLLAVGIAAVSGKFSRGEIISVQNIEGAEIAKGISNYDSRAINKIKGISSENIESTLGYVIEKHIIHRDNLALTGGAG
ncbi:MAG: glutamate 5-kinase [Gammaproteobacteria bacterium]|nr:MAG: glutamate 5-kinase [Gammaproteobacteria bacterium]